MLGTLVGPGCCLVGPRPYQARPWLRHCFDYRTTSTTNYCATAIPLLLLHYLTTSTTQLLYYCYTPLPRYRATSTTQLLYYTSTSLPRYFDHRTTYRDYADTVPQIYLCYSTTSVPGYFPYHATALPLYTSSTLATALHEHLH